MVEQWGIFLDRSNNWEMREQILSAIKDVFELFPDLMTNRNYFF